MMRAAQQSRQREDEVVRPIIPLVTVVALTSCIPLPVSSACRQAASDCLAQCPPSNVQLQSDRVIGLGTDSRSACEKGCHDRASSCK